MQTLLRICEDFFHIEIDRAVTIRFSTIFLRGEETIFTFHHSIMIREIWAEPREPF